MNAKDAIKHTIEMGHQVLTAYLSDLSEADLLLRPVAGANHIAWQLGHLISSEHEMMSGAGVTMPALPEGFSAAHSPEASKSDDPAKFHKKDEYLGWMTEQRTATLAAVDAAADADLDNAAPEAMQAYVKTTGGIFNMIGVHEMMHAAQFVAVRRKLSKPVLI